MTTFDRIERQMPVLLDDLVAAQRPDYLDDILGQTAATSQRPGWTIIERWLPMSAITERLAPAPRLPWRTIGAVALIALALVAGALFIVGNQPQKLPAPFGLAANGDVAYAANGDIFAVDPATGETRALVSGPEADSAPVFSPDGTMVAFTRTVSAGRREVWVVKAEGGSPVRVTPEPLTTVSHYEFSPDGETIMIDRLDATPGVGSVVSIAATDGSDFRTLDIEGSAASPTFRPSDGKEIAFVGGSPFEGQGIFAYDLASGKVRSIVEPVRGFQVTGGPAFSPDGSRIAYGWWGEGPEINSRVYVVDADGAGVPRLIEPPVADTFCCEGYPIWSNDGTRLAHFRLYDQKDSLVIRPADAGGTGMEVEVPYEEAAAIMWSPDDRYILLQPADNANSPLQQVLIDAATGQQLPVTWEATSPPAWQRVAAD